MNRDVCEHFVPVDLPCDKCKPASVQKSTLREAAQAVLDRWDSPAWEWLKQGPTAALMADLRAALAEPVHEPEEFDHGIGANRFKVVRGAFWWHVLIGDSPTEHGKFRSRAGAEKMAADLLREFRNGAFVQHKAALAEPVQEPVAWMHTDPDKPRVKFLEWREDEPGYRGRWIKTPLYAAPQRCPNCASLEAQNTELDRKLAELERK